MATQDDVRRIARALPEVTEGPDVLEFAVGGKRFVWRWRERVDPRRAKVPSDEVIGVTVAHEFDKATLIEMDPDVFLTEPHYDGYPAILVRLAAIEPEMLTTVVTDGWRARAPKRLHARLPG
jgi:hypothetical protein